MSRTHRGATTQRTRILLATAAAIVVSGAGAGALWASGGDGGSGSGDRFMNASYGDFAADLEYSRVIVNGVRVGDSCDLSSGTFLIDPASPQPVLVPVADFTTGECTIGGWSYRVLPLDIPADLVIVEGRVTRGPIFDDAGVVVAWQDPPEVLVDDVYVD